MEVILMESVENLGAVGDKVSVKSGFARNYLVPQGKAKLATAANLAEFEARRAELEKLAAEAVDDATLASLKFTGNTPFICPSGRCEFPICSTYIYAC